MSSTQTMMAPVKKEYPVEAMKMEPMKIEYPIAKTFIQYPTLRSPSLEAFVKERETSSCPASRMASIDEDDEATNVPNSPTNTSVNLTALAKEIEYTVKNTFIDYPAWESLRNPSLEGFFSGERLQVLPSNTCSILGWYLGGRCWLFRGEDFPCRASSNEEHLAGGVSSGHQCQVPGHGTS